MSKLNRDVRLPQEAAIQAFTELPLHSSLLKALRKLKLERPSPVQAMTLPAALEGSDVIAEAKSGTGKTVTFGLVILQRILEDASTKQMKEIPSDPSTHEASDSTFPKDDLPADGSPSSRSLHLTSLKAVVLSPTRELCIQNADEIQRLGWYMHPPLQCFCMIGGIAKSHDYKNLMSQPSVLVATPGRLRGAMKRYNALRLQRKRISVLVLDEADLLLEHSFRLTIEPLLRNWVAPHVQLIAVSATFPSPYIKYLEDTVQYIDQEYTTYTAETSQSSKSVSDEVINTPKERKFIKILLSTSHFVPRVTEGLVDEWSNEKSPVLAGLKFSCITFEDQPSIIKEFSIKFKIVKRILAVLAFKQCIIFSNKPTDGMQLAKLLSNTGMISDYTSSRLSQNDRVESFSALKSRRCKVLVCSDVMSRGVDATSVDLVINWDIPMDKPTFLHRCGRAARYGRSGYNISIVTEADFEYMNYFYLSYHIKWNPFDMLVTEGKNKVEDIMLFTEDSTAVQRTSNHPSKNVLEEGCKKESLREGEATVEKWVGQKDNTVPPKVVMAHCRLPLLGVFTGNHMSVNQCSGNAAGCENSDAGKWVVDLIMQQLEASDNQMATRLCISLEARFTCEGKTPSSTPNCWFDGALLLSSEVGADAINVIEAEPSAGGIDGNEFVCIYIPLEAVESLLLPVYPNLTPPPIRVETDHLLCCSTDGSLFRCFWQQLHVEAGGVLRDVYTKETSSISMMPCSSLYDILNPYQASVCRTFLKCCKKHLCITAEVHLKELEQHSTGMEALLPSLQRLQDAPLRWINELRAHHKTVWQ